MLGGVSVSLEPEDPAHHAPRGSPESAAQVARHYQLDPRIPATIPGFDAPFFQAGLAGYSDGAMRLIARQHGAPFCITEALLDRTLINGGKGRRKEDPDLIASECGLGEVDENRVAGLDDHPIAGQVMGTHPDEMAKAARILGVEHEWLGFVDSGLPEGDPPPPLPDGCFAVVPLEEPVSKLVRLIREFRPHVMTTYDENGGYPHPDHIRCHQVSVAAFEAAADRSLHPEAGAPWESSKLYYNHGFIRQRMQTLQDEFAKTVRRDRLRAGWRTGIPTTMRLRTG